MMGELLVILPPEPDTFGYEGWAKKRGAGRGNNKYHYWLRLEPKMGLRGTYITLCSNYIYGSDFVPEDKEIPQARQCVRCRRELARKEQSSR